jgi:hypothetical protein
MAKSRKSSNSFRKALDAGSVIVGNKKITRVSAAKKRRSNYTSTYDSGIVVPF